MRSPIWSVWFVFAGDQPVVDRDLGVDKVAARHQPAGAPPELVDQEAAARSAEHAVETVASQAQQLGDPIGPS